MPYCIRTDFLLKIPFHAIFEDNQFVSTSPAIPFPDTCTSTLATSEPICVPVTQTICMSVTDDTTHAELSMITSTLPTTDLKVMHIYKSNNKQRQNKHNIL